MNNERVLGVLELMDEFVMKNMQTLSISVYWKLQFKVLMRANEVIHFTMINILGAIRPNKGNDNMIETISFL